MRTTHRHCAAGLTEVAESPPDNGGLNVGAVIGAVVGSVVGVILLVALGKSRSDERGYVCRRSGKNANV